MKTAKTTLKAGIAVMMLLSSMSLTACGKRISPTALVPVASAAPQQDYQPIDDTPIYDDNNSASSTIPTGVPNSQTGSFLVDQALLNQWQAKGIAVTGGSIYLTASDTSGLSKKGTVIKMNSSDGKSWKDLGSKYLGLSHPIAATVTGIAVLGGNIVAVDSASKAYLVDATKGSVKTLETAGGTDVAAGAGSLFIANGSVEKSDSSASSRSPMSGLTATGGVGADNMGNVYAVSGNTIKKADPSGQVQDLITSDLTSPIDVAADSRDGSVYVLDGTMIKRFSSSGQLSVTFSSSSTKPVSIAVDESGALYVADQGTSNKDSKVIKFAAALPDANATSSYNSSSSSSYNSSSSGDYGTYSNTKAKTVVPATSSVARRK